MSYQPPLHIIKKDQPPPPDKTVKVASRESKISNWVLSYQIKGMAFGLAVSWFYCYFFLADFSAIVLILGPLVGWILGWLVGRFFYRD